MPTTLEEALREVELEPGRQYRVRVRDLWIELRVLEESAPSVEAEVPVEPWVSLPEPTPVGEIQLTEGPLDMPAPPDIPEETESE